MPTKTHTIVGTDFPDSAPPSVGAHFIFPGGADAMFFSVGTTQPEHWIQFRGIKKADSVEFGNTLPVGRMVRSLEVGGAEQTGPSAPISTLTFPAWQAAPHGLEILIYSAGDGVAVPVDLDFSALGTAAGGFNVVQPSTGATFSYAAGVLSVIATAPIRLSFEQLELAADSGEIVGIGGVIVVSAIPETVFYG